MHLENRQDPPPPLQAFVFDGRNIVDLDILKKIGFQVWGVGKSLSTGTNHA